MAVEAAVAEGADRRLRELAGQLDAYGWAAELLDDQWRLVWVSDELLTMYGERDPARVGVGDHVLVSRSRGVARGVIKEDSADEWLRINGPFLLEAAGGAEDVAEMLDAKRALRLGRHEEDPEEPGDLGARPAPHPGERRGPQHV
jgi:hypothetical protein